MGNMGEGWGGVRRGSAIDAALAGLAEWRVRLSKTTGHASRSKFSHARRTDG